MKRGEFELVKRPYLAFSVNVTPFSQAHAYT